MTRRIYIAFAALLGLTAAAFLQIRPAIAAPQDASSFLKTYIGKRYLFRGEGASAEIHISRANLGTYRGQCDVALEITAADFQKSELQFQAVVVGTVRLAGHNTNTCPGFPAANKIIIAGLTEKNSPQEIAQVVSKVLIQPEAYLASYNVTIAAAPSDSGEMETPLAQSGTIGLIPPKPILSVDATYTAAARKSRLNGTITAQVTVGRDGHLYSGAILNSLDPELDQRVLSLFSLWRLQPARVDGYPVAFRVSLESTFRLY